MSINWILPLKFYVTKTCLIILLSIKPRPVNHGGRLSEILTSNQFSSVENENYKNLVSELDSYCNASDRMNNDFKPELQI